MPENTLAMLRGTLDVMILKSLSWGPAHGYAVASWIQEVTENALMVEEGSLYPALHRLERRGWVESEWGLSENNRRAKYYRLTDEGWNHLRAEASVWSRFAEAVERVLNSPEQPAWAEGA
jgi:transcriptional regulator